MDDIRDITFVTYADLPAMDGDDALALGLLEDRGFSCGCAVWNSPDVDWERAGLCVVRSTWDYHLHVDKFLQWVKERSSQIVNSASLINWNSNKRYLVDLERRGVNIVPTSFFAKGAPVTVRQLAQRRGWTRIIVKPAIGLATFGVKSFQLPEEWVDAQQHAEELLKDGDILVQQFMNGVADYGERALIFFNGQYSHAVRKEPFQKLATAGGAGEESVRATNAERIFAEEVIGSLRETPLYARVDIVPNEQSIALLELELVEPSLFLSFDTAAPARFADALERVLSNRRHSVQPDVLPESASG